MSQKKRLQCPKGQEALFICTRKECQQIGFICHSCQFCKNKHEKCFEQTRIAKYFQRIEELKKKDPSNHLSSHMMKNLPRELTQQTIKQLGKISSEHEKEFSLEALGLSENNKKVLKGNNQNLKSSEIVAILEKDMNFTDERFLIPPQYIQQTKDLQAEIQKWNTRKKVHFRIYRLLAKVDCRLKDSKYESMKKIKKPNELVKELKQLNKFMDTAISQRLGLVEEKKQISQGDIKNFSFLSMRMKKLLSHLCSIAYREENYALFEQIYTFYNNLFSESRKEFKLSPNERIKETEYMKAKVNIRNQKYNEAYDFFCQQEKDFDVLKQLVELCKIMKKEEEQLVFLKMQEELRAEEISILKEILKIYRKKKQIQQIEEYLKKLIANAEKLKKGFEEEELFSWYTNNAELKWNKERIQALMNYDKALRICHQQINSTKEVKWIIYFCQIRQMITYQYLIKLEELKREELRKTLQNTVDVCKGYLGRIEGTDKKIIKKYYVRFLSRLAVLIDNYEVKKKCLMEAIQLCEEISFKFFQPYLQAIEHTFGKEKSEESLVLIQKSFKIYPHFKFYYYSGIAHYKRSNQFEDSLKTATQHLTIAISLNSKFSPARYLRGRCYFKLKEHQRAVQDFSEAIQLGEKSAETYSDLSQCLELLKKENYLLECEKLYRKSLQFNDTYEKSLLGLGRILKELKEVREAEKYLKRLVEINGSECPEAYMYLGNIEEEKGKEDERLSEKYFQSALSYYERAKPQEKNKQNLWRILKLLGRNREAVQFQKRD